MNGVRIDKWLCGASLQDAQPGHRRGRSSSTHCVPGFHRLQRQRADGRAVAQRARRHRDHVRDVSVQQRVNTGSSVMLRPGRTARRGHGRLRSVSVNFLLRPTTCSVPERDVGKLNARHQTLHEGADFTLLGRLCPCQPFSTYSQSGRNSDYESQWLRYRPSDVL